MLVFKGLTEALKVAEYINHLSSSFRLSQGTGSAPVTLKWPNRQTQEQQNSILQIKIDHGHNLLVSEGQVLVHCLPSKPTVNSECQADTQRKLRTHTTCKLFNKGNALSVAFEVTMSTHTHLQC